MGVKPDVAVPSADALERARVLALETLLKRNASTAPVEARWTLERLNAERAGVHLTPEEAAAYVETYGNWRVALEDGVLVYRRDRTPAMRLVPLGGDAFAIDGLPSLHVAFERGGDRKITVMVITTTDGDTTSFARSADGAR